MKRFLAILLTFVLILSSFTCFASAATAINILTNPAVFVGGEIYNVVWTTDVAGTGYVEYTYNGTLYRVYDEENGIVRTDDTMHSVQVPKEHLDGAGSYTVKSTAVTDRVGYSAVYGNTCSVTRSFKGYHNQQEINIWTVTDTHGIDMNIVKTAVNNLPAKTADMLFMLGDITTYTHGKMMSQDTHSIEYIIKLAELLTGGTIPVAYTRGNHETRSKYSTYIKEYLAGDTGELYFTFDYGPLSSIVVDYGEDKVDTHHEYTGFASFDNYRKEQTYWLSGLDGYNNKDSQYKIVLSHGGDTNKHYGNDWTKFFSEYGTDYLVSGHTHYLQMCTPTGYKLISKTLDKDFEALIAESVNDDGTAYAKFDQYVEGHSYCTTFPVWVGGFHYKHKGAKQFVASQFTLKNGVITTTAATSEGPISTKFEIQAGLNEQNIIEGYVEDIKPADYRNPDYYKANDDNKVGLTTVANDTSFKFLSKPVVFDVGNKYYNVVWSTTHGESATGEVRVNVDGKIYKFSDSASGYYRINSNKLELLSANAGNKNIHSVIVPKKYLEMGKYECVSRHIMNVEYTTNMELGIEISTGLIDFDGYDDGEDVEMLVVSQWEESDKMYTKVRNMAKTADVIVMNGSVAQNMQSPTDFVEMLYGMGIVSNGKKPVYFVRGNSEIQGDFAPYVINDIQVRTGQFYNKVEFGPVSTIILDTASKIADDAVYYNGLAVFENVRVKQLGWLKGQSYGDSTYNLVFSESAELYNNLGTDYNKVLNTLGTDLAVFSDSETSYFNARDYRAQSYAIAGNGSYKGDGTVATKLNFADGIITVTALSQSGSAIKTNTVDTTVTKTDYTDVDDDAWYSDAVDYTTEQNLMVGVGDDKFAPEDKVTRAQAAVVLANLENADLSKADIKATPFKDVDEKAYYAAAVAWCYENKVTYGTSETTFSPDMELTREQLCTLICNMYPEKFPVEEKCDFVDFADVSDWAKTSVAAMAKAGVVSGTGNGKFEPKTVITRASLAQILYAADI